MRCLALLILLSGCASSSGDKNVPDNVICTLAICEIIIGNSDTTVEKEKDSL